MAKDKTAASKIPSKAKNDKGMKSAGKKDKKQAPKSKGKAMSQGSQENERKKIRFKPGTVVLREIKRYQKTTQLLLPRAPFQRLVREVCKEMDPDLRFAQSALTALQESTEAYLVGLFEDANMCCVHSKRVTLTKQDMQLAYRIRGDMNHDYVEREEERLLNSDYVALPYDNDQQKMQELRAHFGV